MSTRVSLVGYKIYGQNERCAGHSSLPVGDADAVVMVMLIVGRPSSLQSRHGLSSVYTGSGAHTGCRVLTIDCS